MKRIKLKHGTARVDDDCPQETIDFLNKMVQIAYEMDKPRQMKAEKVNIGSELKHKEKGIITVLGITPHCDDYRIATKEGWVYLKNCEEVSQPPVKESLGAEEFYKEEKPYEWNSDTPQNDEGLYGKDDMILFAEEFTNQLSKQPTISEGEMSHSDKIEIAKQKAKEYFGSYEVNWNGEYSEHDTKYGFRCGWLERSKLPLQKQVETITDKEIEEQYPTDQSIDTDISYINAEKQRAIKWALSKLKPVEQKQPKPDTSELKGFDEINNPLKEVEQKVERMMDSLDQKQVSDNCPECGAKKEPAGWQCSEGCGFFEG